MYSLKELYRIGSGPSSSHTLGPEKACEIILHDYPIATSYIVTLYQSLALTGKGHLTDQIIYKVLGQDKVQILYEPFTSVDHPNTLKIDVYQGKQLLGSHTFVSVGGGSLLKDGQSTSKSKEIYPFKNFNEIKEYANAHQMTLSEIVYHFEDKHIKEYLKEVYQVMVHSIQNGESKDGYLPGNLHVQRKARFFLKPLNENESEEDHSKRMISLYAYSVSEENASGGVIVTAPTCGACGVLPAVLYYYQQKYRLSEDKIIDALATASIFGNIIKQNASISGAFGGCQAEIGSACSMAAAAISYINGGSISEIECAAEIAMEHHLGLTCDPIQGYVQVPCIERNAIAALRAIDASNLAKYLKNSEMISFDTVVLTMYETGKDLNKAYKETAIGGLAKNYHC